MEPFRFQRTFTLCKLICGIFWLMEFVDIVSSTDDLSDFVVVLDWRVSFPSFLLFLLDYHVLHIPASFSNISRSVVVYIDTFASTILNFPVWFLPENLCELIIMNVRYTLQQYLKWKTIYSFCVCLFICVCIYMTLAFSTFSFCLCHGSFNRLECWDTDFSFYPSVCSYCVLLFCVCFSLSLFIRCTVPTIWSLSYFSSRPFIIHSADIHILFFRCRIFAYEQIFPSVFFYSLSLYLFLLTLYLFLLTLP